MDTTDLTENSSANFEEFRQRTEDYVRDEPTKAVGIALVAGMALTILPVFRIFGGLLRLAFTLAKPAILIFGAMKLYEEVNKRQGGE
jgi:hypothetical protein